MLRPLCVLYNKKGKEKRADIIGPPGKHRASDSMAVPGGGAVCAFDIDNTITCGRENAKELIGWCRDRGFGLGIITARPMRVPPDDWRELGFSREDLRDNFYHNPRSLTQTAAEHGQHKAAAMESLRQRHQIADKKCVLLLDDMPYNIEAVRQGGYSAVRVGDRRRCGLTPETVRAAQQILQDCVGRTETINPGS